MAGQTIQLKAEWQDQILNGFLNVASSVPQTLLLFVAPRTVYVEDFSYRYSTGQSLLVGDVKVAPVGAAPEAGGEALVVDNASFTSDADTLQRGTILTTANRVQEGEAVYLRFSANPISLANLMLTWRLTTRRH